MKLILPLPPGINKTYGVNRDNVGNPLYKRNVAKDWETDAGWEIRRQWRRAPLQGPVMVGIYWYYKTDRDIDAGIKLTLDVLQKMHVYTDDRQVRFLLVAIEAEPKNPRTEVFIDTPDNFPIVDFLNECMDSKELYVRTP